MDVLNDILNTAFSKVGLPSPASETFASYMAAEC
jgi:hypothetical protein